MPQRRLLVVDDDPEFRQFVNTVATELGYAVAEAADGEDFKRLYSDTEPSTIVLDLIMPQTDGIDLLKWLVDRGCRSRVIIVSGYDAAYSKMAKMIGEEGGVPRVDTFSKPIRLDTFRTTLQ